jgi:hypothetical protein
MKGLLVSVFVIVISLPLGANLAGVDGADPGAEHRELAAFHWENPGAWFEDHFGFRAALIRWYGESRLFLLGVSPSAAVATGRDGWLFYADDSSLDDFARIDPMTPDAVANWREAIVRARDWLREQPPRGVPYVLTVAPDKHVIYPGELPPTLVQVGDLSRTDQLFTALQDLGVAVDVRPALFEARTRERLYQRTDTHWNDRGALIAYQQIINAVRLRVTATPPAWSRDEFDAVDRDVPAMDLGRMIGLSRVLRETDMTLVPRRPRRARVIDPAGAKPTDELGRIVTEIDDPALPRALIFRDSFVTRLVPFLSEHFSRAVYVWENDFDADLVLKEHPDVVIQEIVGRHLYSFIPSPELVPDR